MNIQNLNQKLSLLDSKIGFVADLFTTKFCTAVGTLEKIGSMETSTKLTTDSTAGVVGQAGSNGGFGAVGKASSTTKAEVSQKINLLKIGGKSFTDISIPSSGFFDAIDIGDDIGVIMSADSKSLLYIHDYSDDSSIGTKPSSLAALGKRVLLGVSVLLAYVTLGEIYTAVTTLALPNFALPVFAIVFFVLYRAAHIGAIATEDNWNQAIAAIINKNY